MPSVREVLKMMIYWRSKEVAASTKVKLVGERDRFCV